MTAKEREKLAERIFRSIDAGAYSEYQVGDSKDIAMIVAELEKVEVSALAELLKPGPCGKDGHKIADCSPLMMCDEASVHQHPGPGCFSKTELKCWACERDAVIISAASNFAARVQERCPSWFEETGTDFAEANARLAKALEGKETLEQHDARVRLDEICWWDGRGRKDGNLRPLKKDELEHITALERQAGGGK